MLRLLLVDDKPERLSAFRELARKLGFEDIVECADLTEARDLLDRGVAVDLAIVDIVLIEGPPLQKLGLIVIQELKQAQPDCKVIALTSHAARSYAVEALESGADDFICTLWDLKWQVLLSIRLGMWRDVLDRHPARA